MAPYVVCAFASPPRWERLPHSALLHLNVARAGDLGSLFELGATGEWEFDGVALRLTNLDKVLFPARSSQEPPVTKRDLIAYYATVAPVMLPYLQGRPLNMHRYPDGADRPGFWHKEVPSHAPE